MVGLHVLHDKVVGAFALKQILYIAEKDLAYAFVYAVEDCGFFV